MNKIEKKCEIHDCCFTEYAKGFCKRHYVKSVTKKTKESEIKNCKIPPAHGKVYSNGFCPKHYKQYLERIIDIDGDRIGKLPKDNKETCKIKDCSNKISDKGFCSDHYSYYKNALTNIPADPLVKVKLLAKSIIKKTS